MKSVKYFQCVLFTVKIRLTYLPIRSWSQLARFHTPRRPNKSKARRKTAFVSKPSSIFKHNKQCEKCRRSKEFSVFTSEIARPMKSGTSRSTVSYFSPSSAKAGGGLGSFSSMLQRLQTRLRTFVVFASKVWTFICYVFRKQTRSVSDFPSFLFTMVF